MPFRFHGCFGGFAPSLSSAHAVLAIPLKRSATMQFAELPKHRIELNDIAQYMIVIGKYDPGENGTAMSLHEFIELR